MKLYRHIEFFIQSCFKAFFLKPLDFSRLSKNSIQISTGALIVATTISCLEGSPLFIIVMSVWALLAPWLAKAAEASYQKNHQVCLGAKTFSKRFKEVYASVFFVCTSSVLWLSAGLKIYFPETSWFIMPAFFIGHLIRYHLSAAIAYQAKSIAN